MERLLVQEEVTILNLLLNDIFKRAAAGKSSTSIINSAAKPHAK